MFGTTGLTGVCSVWSLVSRQTSLSSFHGEGWVPGEQAGPDGRLGPVTSSTFYWPPQVTAWPHSGLEKETVLLRRKPQRRITGGWMQGKAGVGSMWDRFCNQFATGSLRKRRE